MCKVYSSGFTGLRDNCYGGDDQAGGLQKRWCDSWFTLKEDKEGGRTHASVCDQAPALG